MLSESEINTIIITAGTIIVGSFGTIGARQGIRYRKKRRRNEVAQEESEAVERYSSDPGQFVRDVLRSNDQLTARVEAAEKKADRIEKAFEAFKAEDRKFRNALARWVSRIMQEWGIAEEMPYPEGDDATTLADVIPSSLEATQPRPPGR